MIRLVMTLILGGLASIALVVYGTLGGSEVCSTTSFKVSDRLLASEIESFAQSGYGPAKLESAVVLDDSMRGNVSPDTIFPSSQKSNRIRLPGTNGSSARWYSGWLDLAMPTDFREGDKLQLVIGGTGRRAIVRLSTGGISPESSDGILGGPVLVPESRIVELRLDTDRLGIVQISVHGGPNPWRVFPLGADNGAVTLEAVTLIRPLLVKTEGSVHYD